MIRIAGKLFALMICLMTTFACAQQESLAVRKAAPIGTQQQAEPTDSNGPIQTQSGPTPIEEIFEPVGNFPESKFMKVAVLQWAPPASPLTTSRKVADQAKAHHSQLMEKHIRKAAAAGAKMVITPEYGVVGYPDIPELPDDEDVWRSAEEIEPYAEPIPGPTTNFFSRVARDLGIYLQIGGVEKLDGKYYNFAVMFDPEGRIIGKHHKNTLYGIEDRYITPGTVGTIVNTPAGRLGMLVCADVYDRDLMTSYKGNVDIITNSASWAEMNSGWSYFTRGAMYVGAYMLASNNPYAPDAGVINPDGTIQSRIRQTFIGIAYGYLPLKTPQQQTP